MPWFGYCTFILLIICSFHVLLILHLIKLWIFLWLSYIKFSGLQLNKGKSRVYFDGFADHDKAALCGLPGFQCGPLPVRYLGVPLIFTKLTTSEFSPLIDKITAKIKFLVNQTLPYVGRLQIIKTMLFLCNSYCLNLCVLSWSSCLWIFMGRLWDLPALQ